MELEQTVRILPGVPPELGPSLGVKRDDVVLRRRDEHPAVIDGWGDKRPKTECGFHLFPPSVSALKDESISVSVAGRGKNFADSLLKPFGPMGMMAPAFASAQVPLRVTTHAPSAGQFWYT